MRRPFLIDEELGILCACHCDDAENDFRLLVLALSPEVLHDREVYAAITPARQTTFDDAITHLGRVARVREGMAAANAVHVARGGHSDAV